MLWHVEPLLSNDSANNAQRPLLGYKFLTRTMDSLGIGVLYAVHVTAG
jgi:hypothetical protein